jgi:hypothetical protein
MHSGRFHFRILCQKSARGSQQLPYRHQLRLQDVHRGHVLPQQQQLIDKHGHRLPPLQHRQRRQKNQLLLQRAQLLSPKGGR